MYYTPTGYAPYGFANRRHIGPSPRKMAEMLETVGAESLDAFIDAIVPAAIRQTHPLAWGKALTERGVLERLRNMALKNTANASFTCPRPCCGPRALCAIRTST